MGVDPGEDWDENIKYAPERGAPAACPSQVCAAPASPLGPGAPQPFFGVPPALGSLAPRLGSLSIARPLFARQTEVPAAHLFPSVEIWRGPVPAEVGEGNPGVIPTVAVGLDGDPGPDLDEESEGGAAAPSHTLQIGENDIRGNLPEPPVPQIASGVMGWPSSGPVHVRPHVPDTILTSRTIADASSRQIAGLGTHGTGTRGWGQRDWDMRNWDSGTGTCGTGTAGLGHAELGQRDWDSFYSVKMGKIVVCV